MKLRIRYNAPVLLTFSLLALAVHAVDVLAWRADRIEEDFRDPLRREPLLRAREWFGIPGLWSPQPCLRCASERGWFAGPLSTASGCFA